LDGFDFLPLTEEEYNIWRLSTGFNDSVKAGRLLVTQTDLDHLPKRKAVIPSGLKPDSDYDHTVAYQIAMAPDQTDDMQLARINVFREADDKKGTEWMPEADTTYLKNRHLPLLMAAEWYLTSYVDKRTSSQNRRLKDVRRQIRSIKSLM